MLFLKPSQVIIVPPITAASGKDAKRQGFQHTPCSPEHPEGNGVAERFMATIVKVVHAAMAENKDPKIEVDRRLLNYRKTVYPSTGNTPSQLMTGRIIRTKIPQLMKRLDTKADLEEARQQDQQTKLRRKELRDQRKTAKEKDYKIGDRVLISQRKTTTKPPFDPRSFEIEKIKGTQIIASRGSQIKVRNMAKVKLLKPRPQHLLPHRPKQQTAQESSDEDWLDLLLPQDEQQTQVDQDPYGGEQEQGELQDHQEQEEQGSNPDLQEQEEMYESIAKRKTKRTKKNIERLGTEGKVTKVHPGVRGKRSREKPGGESRRSGYLHHERKGCEHRTEEGLCGICTCLSIMCIFHFILVVTPIVLQTLHPRIFSEGPCILLQQFPER